MKFVSISKKQCSWCNQPATEKMIQAFKDGSQHVDYACDKHYKQWQHTYNIK